MVNKLLVSLVMILVISLGLNFLYADKPSTLTSLLTLTADDEVIVTDTPGTVPTTKIMNVDNFFDYGDSLFLKLDQTTPQSVINGSPIMEGIQFDTTPSTSNASEGLLRWNSTDGTLDLGMSAGTVTQQVGQELFQKVRNVTTATILNGMAVYTSGRTGNRPNIWLANSAYEESSNCIGVTTQDIASPADGYVTTMGYVRGIKTDYTGSGVWGTTWVAGDNLYISNTTPGQLTNVEPSAPHHSDIVATVEVVHQNLGSILVNINKHKTMEELTDVNGTALTTSGQFPVWNQTAGYFDFNYNINGRKYNHGIEAIGAYSFNNTTHILTIASGTNTYWYKGTKYTTSSAITCDIDSFETLTTNVLYYFYFDDATGTMKCSDSAWNFKENVFVGTVFWNGSAGAIQKEPHTYQRDIDWHEWAHDTIGTRYQSGSSVTNPTTTNDALLQIETGAYHDEDLDFSTGQCTTMRGWYKTNATTYTYAEYSLPYVGTSGQPQYLDTDTYTLTNVGATDFVNMWVYATNDNARPIYIIPTHAATAFNNINDARNATSPVTIGLNINAEFKLIYKFIYKGDGNFQELVDYRSSSPVPGGGVPTVSAGAVSFVPTGNLIATDVQSALVELDTEKQSLLTNSAGLAGALSDETGSATGTPLAVFNQNPTLAGLTISTSPITLSTDTNFVLSGGVNGASFDTDTLSIDATNNRIGIGNTAPSYILDIQSTGLAQVDIKSAADNPVGTNHRWVPTSPYSGDYAAFPFVRGAVNQGGFAVWGANYVTAAYQNMLMFYSRAASGGLLFTTRPSATDLIRMAIRNDGDIEIPTDNQLLQFGTGLDASIFYDGTNFVISPRDVGTGALCIGVGGAGVDYQVLFNGESNDGDFKWMEDENYFQFNDSVMMTTGASINEFSTDGTMAGNSDTAVPTEKAIKTYVDTQVAADSTPVAFITGCYPQYSSTTQVVIKAGYGKCNGNYFALTSDSAATTVGTYNNGAFTYVYVDDSASAYPTPTIIFSTTAPSFASTGTTWGWYNGADRCIGALYCDAVNAIDKFQSFQMDGGLKIRTIIETNFTMASTMNPNGAWQTPDDLTGSTITPVNGVGLLVRIDTYDADNTCYVAAIDYESSLINTSITSGAAIWFYGKFLASCSGWVQLGASRNIRIGAADDDDDGNLQAFSSGFEYTR